MIKEIDKKKEQIKELSYEYARRGIDLEELMNSITSMDFLKKLVDLQQKNVKYLERIFENYDKKDYK